MCEIHAPPTLRSSAPPGIAPRHRLPLVRPHQPLTCPSACALQADLGRRAGLDLEFSGLGYSRTVTAVTEWGAPTVSHRDSGCDTDTA